VRLRTPRAGATVLNDLRTGAAIRVAPSAAVSVVIETAVKTARITSETTARLWESIEASSRMLTPALPPMPWTRPMP